MPRAVDVLVDPGVRHHGDNGQVGDERQVSDGQNGSGRNDADLRYVPRDYDRAEDGYADVYVHRAGSLDLLSDVLRGRSAKIGFRDAAGVDIPRPFHKGTCGATYAAAVNSRVPRRETGLERIRQVLGSQDLGHHRRACGPLDRLCLDRGRIGVHQQPFGKTDRRAGRQRLHPRQAVLVLSRGYYLVSGTVQPAVCRDVCRLTAAGSEYMC